MDSKELIKNVCVSCLDELAGFNLLPMADKKQTLSIVGDLIGSELQELKKDDVLSLAIFKKAIQRLYTSQRLCTQSDFTDIDQTANNVHKLLECCLSHVVD